MACVLRTSATFWSAARGKDRGRAAFRPVGPAHKSITLNVQGPQNDNYAQFPEAGPPCSTVLGGHRELLFRFFRIRTSDLASTFDLSP